MKKLLYLIIFSACFLCMLRTNCVFDRSGLKIGLHIASSTPPDGCKGSSYYFKFRASGGKTPYTWDLASGSLPTGLKLDKSKGILSGIPTTNGSFTFNIEVIDNEKKNYIEEYTIKIKDFNITTYDFLYYCPGEPINYQLETCGGTPPLIWTKKSGSLPSGIGVTSDGRIAGNSSATGTFTFTVSVQDNAGKTAEKEFTLTSTSGVSILSTSPLPQGSTSTSYPAFQLKACGGFLPYSWSNPDGKLPKGLNLSSSGLISGTPTSSGIYDFKVVVKDSSSPFKTDYKYFSIKIVPSPLVITSTSPLPDATECKSYSYTFTASGGTGNYTWKIPATSKLPDGLNLDSSGMLSGKPPVPMANPYSFIVQLSDGIKTASKTFALKVLEDAYITPELIIAEVRHTPGGPYNTITLSEQTQKVRVDFRFVTASYLQNPIPQARLQVVGDCTTISTVNFSGAWDPNNDGLKEKVARFSPQVVAGLLSSANKKVGDSATLRFWVDVMIDNKKNTFVKKINIKIVQ
ncbi:MAG: Ig domain-containing protein [Candidatus Aminicenantia bacterium]